MAGTAFRRHSLHDDARADLFAAHRIAGLVSAPITPARPGPPSQHAHCPRSISMKTAKSAQKAKSARQVVYTSDFALAIVQT